VKEITSQSALLKERKLKLEKELAEEEDLRECMRRQRAERKEIEKEERALSDRLLTLLNSAGTKDFRSFYIPIREANISYDEGKYDLVNKYLTVILTNFEEDKIMVKSESGINDMQTPMQFAFSYLTDEELFLLDQLIEKDKTRMSIPEKTKSKLSKLDQVIITNDRLADMNEDTSEIYRSTLDLPKGE
jgi:hypothetical protein